MEPFSAQAQENLGRLKVKGNVVMKPKAQDQHMVYLRIFLVSKYWSYEVLKTYP